MSHHTEERGAKYSKQLDMWKTNCS